MTQPVSESTAPQSPVEGSPTVPGYGAVIGFAAPIMVGMLAMAMLTAVDAAFVGRLGTAPLAALGLAGIYYFTWLVLFVGLMRNSIAFLARAHGAGNLDRSGSILVQYQWLALLALPVGWASTWVFPALLGWIDIDPMVAQYATLYLNIRIWDIPFALIVILYGAFYQSQGNSRFPAAVQFSAVLLNGVLDYGLIFGAWGLPELGLAGSALATVIAQALACIFVVAWVHSRQIGRVARLRLLGRPNWPLMKEILQVGLPQGIGDFAEIFAFLVFFFIVGMLGSASLAANNIAVQTTHLLFMPGYAVGIAAASYVGRFLGARQPGVARQTVRRILVLGIAYMALTGVPLWFLGESIARLFTEDPQVVVLAGLVFKVMALYQAFDGLAMVTRGALSGAGDTLVPTLIMGGTALVVLYPSAYWLARVFNPPVMGAWLGALLYLIVVGLLVYWRFDAGPWHRIKINLAPSK